jgi:hypothetical protein
MPRRHGSARERSVPPAPPARPPSAAPVWASAEGFSVRAVSGEKDKPYTCPGCLHIIRPGTPHLVVMPEGHPEGRRHWHTDCWRRELRRLGLAGG